MIEPTSNPSTGCYHIGAVNGEVFRLVAKVPDNGGELGVSATSATVTEGSDFEIAFARTPAGGTNLGSDTASGYAWNINPYVSASGTASDTDFEDDVFIDYGDGTDVEIDPFQPSWRRGLNRFARV